MSGIHASSRGFITIVLVLFLLSGLAEGRNKVQYYPMDWRVIPAEKADIYYHSGEDEIALQAVAIADDFTNKLEAWLNFSFTARVPIIVYAGHPLFANTNITSYYLPEGVGGFTELIKGRVVLPYAGSRAGFRHVLAHELVHAAIRQKLESLYTRSNRLQAHRPPLWLEEGLAEYLSLGFPDEDSSYVAELVVGGGLVPIMQMGSIYGSYRMYKEGQCIIDWLVRENGKDFISRLVEAGVWDEDFNKGMEKLLGYDLVEMDRRWQADMRKRYMPEQQSRSLARDIALPITGEREFAVGAVSYIRKNKTYIACISTMQNDLRVVNMELDELAKVKHPKTLIRIGMSEKAEDILMLGNRLAVSPDGMTLAVPVRSGADYAILLTDSLTGKTKKQLKVKDTLSLVAPSFSPEGKNLVFVSADKSGQPDLYVVEIESGKISRMTNDPQQEGFPAYLDEGKTIIYQADDGNPTNTDIVRLQKLDLSSNKIVRMEGSDAVDGLAVSPDGRRIVYFVPTPQGYDIRLWDMTIDKKETIGRLSGPAMSPTFAPDGQSVLFSASRSGYYILHRLELPSVATEPAEMQITNFTPPVLPQEDINKLDKLTKRYVPRYSLDILQTEVAFGPEIATSLGAIVALTDTLSDRRIAFILGSSAESTSDFLSGLSLGTSYTDLSHRLGWAVAGFRFVESSSIWDERLYDEVRSGAEASFSYPFSAFQRIDLDLVGWYNERTFYELVESESSEKYELEEVLETMPVAGAYVTLSDNNSMWQADGPLDGHRLALTVGNTQNLNGAEMLYTSVRPDVRYYLRFGKSECLALRLVSNLTFGEEALPLHFGGSLSMRGWDWFDFTGTRMAMANAEMRFNLADQVVANTIIGNLGAIPLRGAFFVDAGEAWNGELPDHFRMDAGFGFRWALAGVLVLRFDWAKRATIYVDEAVTHKGGQILDFKPGFPFQFFLGWSY